MPEIARLHARVAALSRSRADSDPDLVRARRDLAAVRLEAYVDDVVSTLPAALTDDQECRIIAALKTSRPAERARMGATGIAAGRGSISTKGAGA